MINHFINLKQNNSLFNYDIGEWYIRVFTVNSINLKPLEPAVLPLGFSLDIKENSYKIDFVPDWELIKSSVISLGNSYNFKETEREISISLMFLQEKTINHDVFNRVFNTGGYKIKGGQFLGTLSIIDVR